MLDNETQPPVYQLFDHSYSGGSWNDALIREAAALRARAEKAEAENAALKAIEAAMREWHEANQADDLSRWMSACRRMDALMDGTWDVGDTPLADVEFDAVEQERAAAIRRRRKAAER